MSDEINLPSLGKVIGHVVSVRQPRYDQLMAVVEAAKAWGAWTATHGPGGSMFIPENNLIAALDALAATEQPSDASGETQTDRPDLGPDAMSIAAMMPLAIPGCPCPVTATPDSAGGWAYQRNPDPRCPVHGSAGYEPLDASDDDDEWDDLDLHQDCREHADLLRREISEMSQYVQSVNSRIVRAIGIIDDAGLPSRDPSPEVAALVKTLYAVLEPDRVAVRPRCRSEYVRPGGRQPGDRIVRCDLRADHTGDHHEDETGSGWPNVAPAAGLVAGRVADEGEVAE